MQVSAFMHVILTTTKIKTSLFPNLLHPHPSKAAESKTVSTPFLGNQDTVYFSHQHHYHNSRNWGTILSPPGKNTLGRIVPDKISLFAYQTSDHTAVKTWLSCSQPALQKDTISNFQFSLYSIQIKSLDGSLGKVEGTLFLGIWGRRKTKMCFAKCFIYLFNRTVRIKLYLLIYCCWESESILTAVSWLLIRITELLQEHFLFASGLDHLILYHLPTFFTHSPSSADWSHSHGPYNTAVSTNSFILHSPSPCLAHEMVRFPLNSGQLKA